MLAPVQMVAPVNQPVTLDELKEPLAIPDDDDLYIDTLIKVATDYLDGYSGVLGRALITQTWRQDYGGFSPSSPFNYTPYSCIPLRLPVSPVQSVTSVAYYDSANVQQTLSTSVYSLFTDMTGPYLGLAPVQVWPCTYSRPDAVRVTFVAGYGDDPEDVPQSVRAIIRLLVGHWYENREAVTVGSSMTPNELPLAVNALLAKSRAYTFGAV